MGGNYSIGVSGTVPVVCWVKPSHPGEYQIFCNSSSGYDLYAIGRDGERVVDSSDGPTAKTVALDLKEGESTLTIRAR